MSLRLVLLALLVGAAVRPAWAQTGAATPARSDTLVVLSLNLWHDQRNWPARLNALVAQAAPLRPDVLLLQEVLQDTALENQATTLARRLGLPHVHFVSTDGPERARRYGNAIVSRWPFDRTGERRLAPLDQYRTAAFADVTAHGRPLRLYTTHLHHEPTPAGRGIRAMQIVDLLDFADATSDTGAPFVLGGDFNAEPAWPEMRLLSVLRDVPAAFGAMGGTYGLSYGLLPVPGRRIDSGFDGRDPRLVPVGAAVVLDRPDDAGHWPSDHAGVVTRFVFR